MTQFGQPARTATSDANAGFVNTPATKEASRTSTSTNVRATSDLDSAIQTAGASLGSSLTKLLGNKAKNINAQRELDASIRQGEGKAVNAIDVEKKRSGWEEAVFGQNIEYRAAQQRAVGNNIQQAYLEQANSISEYAADTPEQYQTRLRKQLDSQLEQYPNDAETQKLITQNWSKASEKLVQSHSKEHYGYNQLQQRETTKQFVRGTLDVFTTQSQQITSPEEAAEFMASGKSFFNMSGKPEGMSKQAYTSVINEEVMYSLEQGNIGAYNMANASNWFDKLNPKERKQLDASIAKYDTKAGHNISLTVSEAKLAASKVSGDNPSKQIDAIVEQAIGALNEHKTRKSGTDRYDLNLTNAKLSLQGVLDTALQAGAKASVKSDRLEAVIQAQQLANKGDGVQLASLGNLTISEAVGATAERHRRLVGGLLGNEDITNEEAIQAMVADPIHVGSQVVQNWGADQFDAGYVKTLGQSYINGFAGINMVDENDQPTETARNAMQLFAQFEQEDRAKFKKQLGADAYDEYSIIRDGQTAGKTSSMIESEIADFKEAAGNKDFWAVDWNLGKNQSKRDFITEKIVNMTGQQPSGEDVGRYMETFNRGILLGKGDLQRASDYLYDSVKNKSANYKGQVIHNADKINGTLTDHTLPQLIDAIQHPDNNLATGIIAQGIGMSENADGNPIRAFDELNNTRFDVAPDGGLWIKNHKFQHDVYLSPERIKVYEKKVVQNQKEKELEARIEKESEIQSTVNAMERLKHSKF